MNTAVLTAFVLGLPWVGAAAVWCVGDNRPRVRNWLAVSFAAATTMFCLALLPQATSASVLRFSAGGAFGDFTFVPDSLGLLMAAIATGIGALCVVFSLDYMQGESGLARYYALLLVFIGGMLVLVLTGSLLVLLIGWEIVGLCSCALIAFHSDQQRAVAGALRALVMTQIGGVGLLAGILVARTSLGTDQIGGVIEGASGLSSPALIVLAYGFLIAACAKSAQVPFHTWLPGAMEAPTPVSALIHAATMVNAGVYLLLRFSPVLSGAPGWSELVISVGVTSAVMGALMALVSNDLKRVLAYSTISQLGLLFYATGLNATFAAQLHMLSHSIFKGLLFLSAGAVIHVTGTRALDRLGGLAQRMPLVTATFVIGGLALAGVPLLDGFWSKELILDSGLTTGPGWGYIAVLFGSALTVAYTARITWRVFFVRTRPSRHAHDATPAMRLPLVGLALATMCSWLVFGWTPVAEVVRTSATLVGLGAIAGGFAAWYWRDRAARLWDGFWWLRAAALADFGFLNVETALKAFAAGAAAQVQASQTGRLSWNLAAMLTGLTLALVAVAVAYGGLR